MSENNNLISGVKRPGPGRGPAVQPGKDRDGAKIVRTVSSADRDRVRARYEAAKRNRKPEVAAAIADVVATLTGWDLEGSRGGSLGGSLGGRGWEEAADTGSAAERERQSAAQMSRDIRDDQSLQRARADEKHEQDYARYKKQVHADDDEPQQRRAAPQEQQQRTGPADPRMARYGLDMSAGSSEDEIKAARRREQVALGVGDAQEKEAQRRSWIESTATPMPRDYAPRKGGRTDLSSSHDALYDEYKRRVSDS